MSDEKRIKDFEPATEILNDDWFAVDSPSQGTRKMQASMFQAGLQSQITDNRDDIDLQSGQISVLQQAVGNIGDKVDVLDAAITVEEYSATKLYAVDEDCVYEGVRYKCITAIETPEAFTPSHWQAISIEGELNELNSSLNSTDSIVSILNTKLKTNAVSSVNAVLDRALSVEDGSICIMNGVSSLGAILSGTSATCMIITKNVGGSGRVDYFCIQGQGGKIALGSIDTSTKAVTIKWTN